jgi:uncharacterized protein (TIGR03437 family)
MLACCLRAVRCSSFKLLGLALAAALSPSAEAQDPTFEWVRHVGTNRDDQVNAVAVSLSGVYVGGNTIGIFPGETGTLNDIDAFVARFDNAGNLLWAHQFGSAAVATDAVMGMAADATGAYAVGTTNGSLPGQPANLGSSDVFLRKYGADGATLWTRQFGTTSQDQGLAAAADATGVYVAGVAAGHGFVRKFDQNGTELWNRAVASTSTDSIRGIAVDVSGVYVVGLTNGVVAAPAVGGNDIFLRKYDSNGNVIWTKQFGTNTTDQGNSVAVDETGVYVAGDTTGTFTGQTKVGGLWDEFAAKFDLNGNQKWLYQFGTNREDGAYGVAVHPTGAYFVGVADAAPLPGQATVGGYDSWVRRYDPDGNLISTRQFGTANNDEAYAVAAHSTGIYIGGYAHGAFPDQTNLGQVDGWVLRIPPPPNVTVGGVVNNASYAKDPAPVAPGSIAAVFGANLNDGTVVLSSALDGNGKVVTTLGNSSATVNNIPAPMFYSTTGQIGIQIPYEVAGLTATIVVTAKGQTSIPRTFNISPTAPGIFTANQAGTGIAAVMHTNGVTPVTAQDPARPNEIVIIYVTGLGVLTPAVATGALSGGNLAVAAPTVTVDGVAAVLDYAGGAPGYAGLNQINLRIPPNTRTAANIPLVVTAGGKQSNAATIPVAP